MGVSSSWSIQLQLKAKNAQVPPQQQAGSLYIFAFLDLKLAQPSLAPLESCNLQPALWCRCLGQARAELQGSRATLTVWVFRCGALTPGL